MFFGQRSPVTDLVSFSVCEKKVRTFWCGSKMIMMDGEGEERVLVYFTD